MLPVIAVGLLALPALGAATLVTLMRVGRLTLDVGWGRTIHELGPITMPIAAPPELVFEQISGPYLGTVPRSLRGHLEVVERGHDIVLAKHWTDSKFVRAETLELVGFDAPERIWFRHVRGPVPHAVEEFRIKRSPSGSLLEYDGEIGVDFWVLGSVAARKWVRPVWEDAVRASMEDVRDGAQARAAARKRRAQRR